MTNAKGTLTAALALLDGGEGWTQGSLCTTREVRGEIEVRRCAYGAILAAGPPAGGDDGTLDLSGAAFRLADAARPGWREEADAMRYERRTHARRTIAAANDAAHFGEVAHWFRNAIAAASIAPDPAGAGA